VKLEQEPGALPVRAQLLHRGSRPLETVRGRFQLHVCQSLSTGTYSLALARGDLRGGEPLLARIHSSCVTSETFGGCDCDCVDQLDAALEAISREDRGAVFYLMQEGRGAGFSAKVRDRMIVQSSGHRTTTFEAYERMGLGHDHRSYAEVPPLCRHLGVSAPLRLLTNNPDKLASLQETGIEIASTAALHPAASPWNRHYIAAKARSGHAIADPGAASVAELPEDVSYFDPYVLAEDPTFLHVATYLLPLRRAPECGRGAAPHWFRLHAYFDLKDGVDRVVLAYGPADGAEPLVRVQHESLLERFPLADPIRRRVWDETVRRFVAHGAGYAAFVPPAGFREDLSELPGEDERTIALLGLHLRGRAARPLASEADDGRLGAALSRRGVRVLPPVSLDRAA